MSKYKSCKTVNGSYYDLASLKRNFGRLFAQGNMLSNYFRVLFTNFNNKINLLNFDELDN